MEDKDFTKLEVWKKANELVIDIYDICNKLPADEKYNFGDQLKRSSSSVTANIAEGYGRYYFQDNICFCRKARGSLYEVKSHLITLKDLRIVGTKDVDVLLDKISIVSKLLNGYVRHLNLKKPGQKNGQIG